MPKENQKKPQKPSGKSKGRKESRTELVETSLPAVLEPIVVDSETARHGGHNEIKIGEDWEEKINSYSSVGLTVRQMAALLGISKATFEDKIRKNPELAQALEKGRAKAIHNLLGKAYGMAMAGDKLMLIFLLKTRAGLSEKIIHEIQGRTIGDTENKWTVQMIAPKAPDAED